MEADSLKLEGLHPDRPPEASALCSWWTRLVLITAIIATGSMQNFQDDCTIAQGGKAVPIKYRKYFESYLRKLTDCRVVHGLFGLSLITSAAPESTTPLWLLKASLKAYPHSSLQHKNCARRMCADSLEKPLFTI